MGGYLFHEKPDKPTGIGNRKEKSVGPENETDKGNG